VEQAWRAEKHYQPLFARLVCFGLSQRPDPFGVPLEDGLLLSGLDIPDPKREEFEYGQFAWIMDPEGQRIKLWQPPPGM
jgi:hypothetical protein